MIKDKTPCNTPLGSSIDTTQRLEPPITPKEHKKFCEFINNLSMYLKILQERVVPIYNMTRNEILFEGAEENKKNVLWDKVN